MTAAYDAIVVGAGFGGAVVARRLAESGARVLILERGRRWTPGTFPRRLDDPWLYDPARPDKRHGWLDLRVFRTITVAQGAGVGGGSLCYSSVVIQPPERLFDHGWPPEITFDELRPHYAEVGRMLGVGRVPAGQRPQRWKLLRRGAEALGHGERFDSLPLALSFDPEFSYAREHAVDARWSRSFVNDHGIRQGTCVHLGNCDIGCDVLAKNTLDLNYIPAAERDGAEVRPLHVVRTIEPDGTGYRVGFDRIEDGGLRRGHARADRVVLAAGSLGSTELLLRCRDQHGTLPNVSRALGRRWSSNANSFTSAIYDRATDVEQSVGPTITSGLDFMDGARDGARFYVEDDGFPNLLLGALTAKLRSGRPNPFAWALQTHLRRGADAKYPLRNVMIWLGAGVDAADGELRLGRAPLAPWRTELRVDWDVRASRAVVDAINDVHRDVTKATGGRFRPPIYWSLLRHLITVHPLGGCAVASSPDDGVVDHRGEVFGHRNLFVVDGAIVPVAIGANPSMTIAALAERAGALMTGRPATSLSAS